MHLRPGETKLELAERKVPEAIAENEHVKFGGSVSFGWLSNDFDPDGYIGDPTGASEELGAELFTHAVGKLAEGMEEVKTFDFGR
jgi:creatinine amidohydrolase